MLYFLSRCVRSRNGSRSPQIYAQLEPQRAVETAAYTVWDSCSWCRVLNGCTAHLHGSHRAVEWTVSMFL